MPKDPLEIEIALRAGINTWQKFPYLGSRFSERGERFTTSDSCWLITLIPQNYIAIHKSISWLCTVLATRGMPTVILETQLLAILNEYDKAFPNKAALTKNLRQVTENLKTKRERFTNSEAAKTLKEKYQKKLQTIDRHALGDVFELLLSAKADETNGIKNAFRPIATWFLDSPRFDGRWINEIENLNSKICKEPNFL